MKHSSLIILTSILCAVLASCGEQTVQTPENTADAGQTAEVTEAAEENAVYPYAMEVRMIKDECFMKNLLAVEIYTPIVA